MKYLASLLFFLCSFAFAQPEWEYFPAGVASSSSGTSYTVTATMVPSSSFTTYTVYINDSASISSSTGWDATTTTAITFKDSSGNTVCSTPVKEATQDFSASGVSGSITVNRWHVSCNSGTLTNGNTYTLTATGKSYGIGGGGSDMGLWVYLLAQ